MQKHTPDVNIIHTLGGVNEEDDGRMSVCTTLLLILAPAAVIIFLIVQELCESRGGRPGLSVLTSLLVSVDVKNY